MTSFSREYTLKKIDVRLLLPADARLFARIRRQALENEPLAFGSSVEDDRARDPAFVQQLLAEQSDQAVFGAFDPNLVGIVGIYPDRHRKAAHKAHIWGMYVEPEFRGVGVGDALLLAAISYAREIPAVRQIHLGVSETAESAFRLYKRHGFEIWGTEPRALNHNERFVAEHYMILVLE